MSYAVIHMQKLKASGVRGIENHNERLRTSRTNPDIDYEKSHLNKDLLQKDERSYYMRIKERIEELNLSKAIRKDAVVACGFICTSDQAYFEKLSQVDKDRFFQASYDFLKERYGERNVVSSKVHYDETTPHLHCYIVPVTKDGRLSAKSIFTPKELRSLQDDYHRCMKEHGFDLQRGNLDSDRKHLDVEEFKLKTRYEKLNKAKEEFKHECEKLKEKKEKFEVINNRLNVEEKRIAAMEEAQEQRKTRIVQESKTLEVLQQKIDTGKHEYQTLERQKNTLQNDIKALRNVFEGFKDIKDVLEETEAFWDVLESGEIRSRQLVDFQNDIISIQEAYLAKHGLDLLDSLLASSQAQNIKYSQGWDEYEAKANLSKLIGPEAAYRLSLKQRDPFGR